MALRLKRKYPKLNSKKKFNPCYKDIEVLKINVTVHYNEKTKRRIRKFVSAAKFHVIWCKKLDNLNKLYSNVYVETEHHDCDNPRNYSYLKPINFFYSSSPSPNVSVIMVPVNQFQNWIPWSPKPRKRYPSCASTFSRQPASSHPSTRGCLNSLELRSNVETKFYSLEN